MPGSAKDECQPQVEQFGVLASRDMQASLAGKGMHLADPPTIFEVCKPGHEEKVLTADLGLAVLLPCRVSGWQQGGPGYLSILEPRAFIAAF